MLDHRVEHRRGRDDVRVGLHPLLGEAAALQQLGGVGAAGRRDEQLGAGLVDLGAPQRDEGGDGHERQSHGDDGAPAFPDDPQVVVKIHSPTFFVRGVRPGSERRMPAPRQNSAQSPTERDKSRRAACHDERPWPARPQHRHQHPDHRRAHGRRAGQGGLPAAAHDPRGARRDGPGLRGRGRGDDPPAHPRRRAPPDPGPRLPQGRRRRRCASRPRSSSSSRPAAACTTRSSSGSPCSTPSPTPAASPAARPTSVTTSSSTRGASCPTSTCRPRSARWCRSSSCSTSGTCTRCAACSTPTACPSAARSTSTS